MAPAVSLQYSLRMFHQSKQLNRYLFDRRQVPIIVGTSLTKSEGFCVSLTLAF